MKASELREYANEDLERRLGEQRQQLFQLRFQQGLEQSASRGHSGAVRGEIARILTLLRERQLAREAAEE